MDNTKLKDLKIALDIKEEITKVKNSYISKEMFINMLQNLDFIAIKDLRISFITGFECVEKGQVKTFGYDISID